MAVAKITKANFEKEVNQAKEPVLIDFWADWCGPCKILSPVVDELSEELTDVKVGKVNIDEEMELAEEFGVMSIPTLIVMQDGKVVEKSVGVIPKESILQLLGK